MDSHVKKKPSVLLADDDEDFREALRKTLEPEYNVLASVGDGQALLDAARALAPEVILTDITMPVLDGINAVRLLNADQGGFRVIFLSVHEEPIFILEARRRGAAGYIPKRYLLTDLLPAIRKVLAGSTYFLFPEQERRQALCPPAHSSAQ